jgi:protocatechuate 3,4-dioxygenase beta subunit
MSDELDPTFVSSNDHNEATRLPRREALKGLGALAVTTTALAAVGCSSEPTDGMLEPASTSATGGTASAMQPTTTTAAQAGTSASATKPAGMTTGTSTAPTQPMAASAGSASSATPGMAAASGGSSAAAAGGTSGAAGASATPAAGAMASSAGAGGAAAATGTDLSSLACILSPDMTEGPFFIEEKMNRSDLVMGETDKSIVMATPLALTIGVYKVDGMTCTPLPGLQVDIWHADALGIYSDVASGFVQATDTRGKKFLRGYQVTNEAGLVQFATIYPGWYMSRTIHIHFKIRMPMGSSAYDFTSQMFFDEKISEEVLATGPYATAPGNRSVFNDDDHIFQGTPTNGQKPPAGQKAPGLDTMVSLSKMASGYTGLLKIGLKI